MNDQFSQELSRSVEDAIAFLDGEGPAIVHHYVMPRDIREDADLTQEQMASLVGMKLIDYQEWESQYRRLEGAVGNMLQIAKRRCYYTDASLLWTPARPHAGTVRPKLAGVGERLAILAPRRPRRSVRLGESRRNPQG